MVAFVKINGFVEHVATKQHDLAANQMTIALSNTAPASETPNPTVLTADAILANVTTIALTNISTSPNVTTTSAVQSGGLFDLVLVDLTLTATGVVPTFQYVYVYNSTTASNFLIGMWDHGSAVNMVNGSTYEINFDTTGNKLLSLQ